jgi:hypothetical protein
MRLDWRQDHWGGRRAHCYLCGQPAMLIDDDGRPAHKVCVEIKIGPDEIKRRNEADDEADYT